LHPALANLVRNAGIRVLLLKERWQSGIAFNVVSSRLREDPYPTYTRLRAKDPVHRSALFPGYVATRYADVAFVMKDSRFAADRSKSTAAQKINFDEIGPFMQWLSRSLLSIDPPDHTRLRSLVSKAFTPRAVEAMRPRIEQIVEDLLDVVQERGRMDVIADLAYPLPVIVIAEMLGVPAGDRHLFKRWSDDLAEGLEPILSPNQIERANRSVTELTDYLRAIIKERRGELRDDLLSALISASDEGDRLSEDELFGTCILLLAAGNETTTNLIGNGLLALLRKPDQLETLRRYPSLIESAVEELLRYDSPVQMSDRVATEDIQVGRTHVLKGESVAVVFGAANRDPDQFADPDRLDVTRNPNRHFSFGYGIHFCLGAPLARVEGQIAINAILRRLPNLRLLTDTPRWRPTITLRGLKALPVSFAPGSKPEPAAEAAVAEPLSSR
jgi:cytochrome P450